jgi:hypothetical protein
VILDAAGTGSSTNVPTIGALPGWAVLVAIVGVILLSGVVVIIGRRWLDNPTVGQDRDSGSLVRSWIAIALVAALTLFCAIALSLNDSSLRSTLFGGLVTSVGAAVAFYFSSKSADQARQDVLTASLGTTDVPDLSGLTVTQARTELGKTPLQLALRDPSASDQAIVQTQVPSPESTVRSGSKVTVTTAPAGGDGG